MIVPGMILATSKWGYLRSTMGRCEKHGETRFDHLLCHSCYGAGSKDGVKCQQCQGLAIAWICSDCREEAWQQFERERDTKVTA